MLQYVAVRKTGYPSFERYVAACCSVLQCVAACCSALQCVAVCCGVLQCVAVFCSVQGVQASHPPSSDIIGNGFLVTVNVAERTNVRRKFFFCPGIGNA